MGATGTSLVRTFHLASADGTTVAIGADRRDTMECRRTEVQLGRLSHVKRQTKMIPCHSCHYFVSYRSSSSPSHQSTPPITTSTVQRAIVSGHRPTSNPTFAPPSSPAAEITMIHHPHPLDCTNRADFISTNTPMKYCWWIAVIPMDHAWCE